MRTKGLASVYRNIIKHIITFLVVNEKNVGS
jgi:hypothetical protein